VSVQLRDCLGRAYTPAMRAELLKGRPPANKGRKYPAEVLSAGEVNALLATCSRRGTAGIRNRAMFVVQWRCGLRVAEMLDLELRDLDLDNRVLTVRHGKGDKRRVLGLDDQTVQVIETWLARRRKIGLGRAVPLFCTISKGKFQRPGRKVGYTTYRDALQRAAATAGIEKRVHTHGMRHTFAVDCLREGLNLVLIQKLLGHSDLATTAKYLDHLLPLEAVEAHQARSWPVAVAG
jgi:integrase/recombinase XerD